MSSIRPVRPRCFLLASAALTSFAALDLPAAVAQQAREPLPPVEVSPAQSRKPAKPAARMRHMQPDFRQARHRRQRQVFTDEVAEVEWIA